MSNLKWEGNPCSRADWISAAFTWRERAEKAEAENVALRADKERLDLLEKLVRCGKGHCPQEGRDDSYVFSFVSDGWVTAHTPNPTLRVAIDVTREKLKAKGVHP